MYTRSFYKEDNGISLPDGYDGNAFSAGEEVRDAPSAVAATAEPKVSPRDIPPEEECFTEVNEKEVEEAGFFSSIFSKFQGKRLFDKGGLGFLNLDKFKLGTEEILLIALALFLLFSKDGDKECAIILLCLIFVN